MKDEDLNYVINTLGDEKDSKISANKIKKIIISISASLLSLVIIANSCSNNKKTNTIEAEEKMAFEKVEQIEEVEMDKENDLDISPQDSQQNEQLASVDNSNEMDSEYQFTKKEVEYYNVEAFYNNIVENRNKYGNFAECFQSEDDVRNFVNVFFKFNSIYDAETTIDSQEQFGEIVSDYYKSCVNHDVKPSIGSLFNPDTLIGKKFNESEALVYDLKNGKGNDYTISNNYYMWLEDNLVNKDTAIPENLNYSPLIYAQRRIYDQYREVGNMNAARRNQKNDYYKVEQRDLYYGFEYGEDVHVTIVNHSFSCPDGIDNYVSETENKEETKWIISEDGSVPFETVNNNFDYVLNRGRNR